MCMCGVCTHTYLCGVYPVLNQSLVSLGPPGWNSYMASNPSEVKTESQSDMESSNCSNQQSQVVGNGVVVSSDGQILLGGTDQRSPAFVFPQPSVPVPLSPGLLSGVGLFNQNNNVPITPTLLTPITDGFVKNSSLFSPMTLAPPSSIPQCLPKTPTLPPPSPHATAFPLMSTSFYTTGLFNPPYRVDDIGKFGGLSPLLMSPAAAFPSSHVTQSVFFPSNMPTAEAGINEVSKTKLMSPPTIGGSQHSNQSNPPSIASSMHEEEERKEVCVCVCVCVLCVCVCVCECVCVCVCVCVVCVCACVCILIMWIVVLLTVPLPPPPLSQSLHSPLKAYY